MLLSLPSNAPRTVKSLRISMTLRLRAPRSNCGGPLGGHFLWPERATAPVLLIGAGSGVIPLMAMIRQRRAMAQTVRTALLLSSRTQRDVLFADELLSLEMAAPKFTLELAITRETPGAHF
jgi:ferredoxin-NADP reductase